MKEWRNATTVLAISLGLYAVYLPVAWLLHRNYVPLPRPPGDVVEVLVSYHHDKPDHYIARSHVFRTADFPDSSRISAYENGTPLPRQNFSLTPDNGVYIVRLRASDGSDVRSNGRRYYLVADG